MKVTYEYYSGPQAPCPPNPCWTCNYLPPVQSGIELCIASHYGVEISSTCLPGREAGQWEGDDQLVRLFHRRHQVHLATLQYQFHSSVKRRKGEAVLQAIACKIRFVTVPAEICLKSAFINSTMPSACPNHLINCSSCLSGRQSMALDSSAQRRT